MELIFTKDAQWLAKWDDFILHEDCGSHLLLSDWVFSYHSYGFGTEFCLAVDQGEIVGGFAAVIAKAAMFRFYVVPFGPIVTKGYEPQLDQLIAAVKERAVKTGACYTHVTLAASKTENAHVLSNLPELPSLKDAKSGHQFRYVYGSHGFNWIDLRGFDEESKIMTLKPAVRRNIRNAYRKGLDFSILDTPEGLEEGYHLFLENAKAANYSIRSWEDIRQTLYSLLEKDAVRLLGVRKEGVLKGAILLIRAGNYYTYILGGSKKEVPDLRTGDLLQWEAVKLSIADGFDGYNISLGGSKGVIEFKNSFGTEHVLFDSSQFYWVLKPAVFKAYSLFEKHLRPHKKLVSKILSKVRK